MPLSCAQFGPGIGPGPPAWPLQHGRGDKPDFLVTGPGDGYWIEATVVLGEDAVGQDERARVEQLYAAIERATERDFLLTIHLQHVGKSTPGKRLVRVLDKWLGNLDADEERTRLIVPSETRAEELISVDGWVFTAKAVPKQPELRSRTDLGVIGEKIEGWQVHRYEGERVVEFEGPKRFDETSFLAKGLWDKARHGYDVRGRSFVIAVLCGGLFADDRAMAQALLGRIEYTVGSGDRGPGLETDSGSTANADRRTRTSPRSLRSPSFVLPRAPLRNRASGRIPGREFL